MEWVVLARFLRTRQAKSRSAHSAADIQAALQQITTFEHANSNLSDPELDVLNDLQHTLENYNEASPSVLVSISGFLYGMMQPPSVEGDSNKLFQ